VGQFPSGSLGGRVFFEFRIKGRRIPQQNTLYGFFAFRFFRHDIVAIQTATIGPTIQFGLKALTIEFETPGLFARTTHILDFTPMRRFNLGR
jgi:hypothetical protein